MRIKQRHLIWLLMCMALAVSITCGCGPSRGYSNADGEWCYVLLGSIGDKPKRRPLGVDSETFQVYSKTGYAKDKNRVFFEGREIEGADHNSFHIDDENYARDKNHVYFYGVIVQKANPVTFEILPYPYGKDEQRAYCGTLPMAVDDVESFRVTQPGGLTITSLAGFDGGDLNDYSEELDPKLNIVYSLWCRARTNTQEFQGPIRVK